MYSVRLGFVLETTQGSAVLEAAVLQSAGVVSGAKKLMEKKKKLKYESLNTDVIASSVTEARNTAGLKV